MSIQTIIEILETYQMVASESDTDYEVVVPGDVLDAMMEHLEKMDEPLTDIQQLVECYDKLDTLQLTCPDEKMRPIIGKFVTDAMPLMFDHKFRY